jgi:hypothetical protein
MAKFNVSFYDQKGKCYFRSEACHVDITTYTTLINFSDNDLLEQRFFRAYDEMQMIQVISNMFKITFISGQVITICKC